MIAGLSAALLSFAMWIGDHLAPIATFIAALVALFKEDWVKLWRRPKLSLRLLLGPPDSSAIRSVVIWPDPSMPHTPLTWEGPIFYFRFRVENTGSWPAERVELNLRSISNRLGDGRLAEVRDFIPMNLRWSHSPTNNPTIFETLNPQMGKHCDLGSVSPAPNGSEKPLTGMREGESTFNLATQVFPNNNCHRLKPGKYRLEILAAAQNARPRRFNVDLNWNGIFEDSEERMLTNSLGITISKGKR